MRGEHLNTQLPDELFWGSSPHARGAPLAIN